MSISVAGKISITWVKISIECILGQVFRRRFTPYFEYHPRKYTFPFLKPTHPAIHPYLTHRLPPAHPSAHPFTARELKTMVKGILKFVYVEL
jgi:hypothetical protein